MYMYNCQPVYVPRSTTMFTRLGAFTVRRRKAVLAGTVLVTFPALYVRAAAEERLLRDRLGPAYDAYARRVPMLIPARSGMA